MGGGMAKPKYGNSQSDKDSRSVQDEAISFRSKTSAIKMLLRQEESRAYCRKYILATDKGKEVYLSYYEDAKMLKGDVDEIKFFVKKYSKLENSIATLHAEITDAMVLAKSNRNQLAMLVGRCQDEALVKLSPIFNEYLKSSFYADYLSAEKQREIRHQSDNHAENKVKNYGNPHHTIPAAITALTAQAATAQAATADNTVIIEEPAQPEQVMTNME